MSLRTPLDEGFVAGQVYHGRNGYVSYVAGNAPVILTARHGGDVAPGTIPDRTAGACGGAMTTVTDRNTRELVEAMRQHFHARFGTWPHVVVSNLARTKLDPNRPLLEAACGSVEAAAAALDATTAFEDTASTRSVSRASPLGFSALLRGSRSLGTLYAERALPAVPGTQDPGPRGAPYFSGGDDTRRHACGAESPAYGGLVSGLVCGVQIESHFSGVRDTPASWTRFGDVTAEVLGIYLAEHWGLRLGPM